MKKSTKRLSVMLSAILGTSLVLSACGGAGDTTKKTDGSKSATEEKTYNFRLADNQPDNYPTVLGDKKFAELVEKKSDGRIKISVFPNGQLGDEKSVIEQVQLGAVEFTRVSTGPLAEFSKPLGVFALPYIFDNSEHQWNFLNSDKGKELLKGLEASKLLGLAYYDSGSRNFYTNKPVKSVEDLKGHKIRVQQSQINIDLIDALGGSATPMPYGEVFSSLQTGVIDGAENNLPSYVSANHYQAAKNIILDGHQRVPEVVMVSKVIWDKLSDKDQKIIQEAATESVATEREEWTKMEKDSEAKMKEAGVTIVKVDDVKPWQDKVKPVIDKYRADYKDVLDAIDKARK
ncbi:TRAP transporter substrate-binding protein [Bacillus sp. OK048]|uniref:TRAP transporter substrate-binding protein n=1 Tax=Bacillus sp. OK048 TaxID=1882761 RepID=UPI00087EB7E2|nr:TRAP transporter substrate-binding protein [Bacillus sp. OK048]SDN64181.1 tripartite ATP-independent transporter solute receptor, DctP family [Bacillus sp. OK048]